MFFAFCFLPTIPRSVSGLVWVIGPLIGGTGRVSRVVVWVWVVFGVLRFIFLLVFDIHFCFSMHLPRLSLPLRVPWRWLSLAISSCPLRLRLPFIFLTYVAGFAAFPFRGVGVGFEQPRLRFMLIRGIGVSMSFP